MGIPRFNFKFNFKFCFERLEHNSKWGYHLSLCIQVRKELHFQNNPNRYLDMEQKCCCSRNKLWDKEEEYPSNRNNHMQQRRLWSQSKWILELGK